MNTVYTAMPFANENLNIGTIYFTENFLKDDVKNPVTQAAYTAEEKKALAVSALTAPEAGVIAISTFGDKEVLWFNAADAKKIVSHTDALMVKGNTMVTLDGTVVAEAL